MASASHGLLPTVLAGAGGAALAAVGGAQPWATATTHSPALRSVVARGSDVAPAVLPLALVALAAWGTVLVLRRRARRAAALLGLLAGAGACAAVVAGVGDADPAAARLLGGPGAGADTATSLWPYAAAAGSVVTAAAFLVAYLRAPRWPEMSRRYDAASGDRTDAGGDLWRALDEGRDPTL